MTSQRLLLHSTNVWTEILASAQATENLPPVPSKTCEDTKSRYFWGNQNGSRMPNFQNANRVMSSNRMRFI